MMKRSQKRNERLAARLSAKDVAGGRAHDPWPSPQWKILFRRRLLSWFSQHARALPWRKSREAYPIWVSEIMLQQTQVATVIPYFERFLRRFPTVSALAAADEQDVLRLWEGLGYYRRARQLHAAARRIVAEHEGIFPADAEAVRRLPGIGRYTAGAILSLAFDAREPILEANTIRLFARLLAFRGDPLSGPGQKLLWNAAETILPQRGSGGMNQALMELGSQVCISRAPRCGVCPVTEMCASRRAGLQMAIPRPKLKPQIEHVREVAVVIHNADHLLIVQRAFGERWAGLWDFPRFSVGKSSAAALRQLVVNVAAACSLRIVLSKPPEPLATLRHSVTRFRITLEVFAASLARGVRSARSASVPQQSPFEKQRWVRPAELASYPLSTTGRKIAQILLSESEPRDRERDTIAPLVQRICRPHNDAHEVSSGSTDGAGCT